MRVLLHTCCAPCASHCIGVLRELGHDISLFYSNANISPNEEYLKRLDSVKLLSKHMSVPLFIDECDHSEWLAKAAQGFEAERERGARCERCFRFSLERTHASMMELGFDAFTTTLTISPHKHTPTIFSAGRLLDPDRFMAINFKKNDGFKHSLKLAEELGLYRQNYCGCEFSTRV